MPEQSAEYYQLFVGFEFPPHSFKLDVSLVTDYLRATGDTSDLFKNEPLVPPMAVTAFAMHSLAQGAVMPPGTVHVSQELDFLKLVRIGDTITCYATVSRKIDRGGLRIMNTDLNVVNQENETVLSGKVGFVLPVPPS